MKRLFIAAMVAALFIPVGSAAPAQADWFSHTEILTVSVDNTDGAEPMSVFVKVTCDDGNTASIGSPDAPEVVAAGDSRGESGSCELTSNGAWEYTVDGVNCYGSFEFGTRDNLVAARGYSPNGQAVCPGNGSIYIGDTQYTNHFMFEENNAGVYNFMITTPVRFVEKVNEARADAAANANTADTRSKITNYVTLQPNRVTAMAKRFVDAPGSLINIHGYGPDRDVALARANHIRDHLISEITRLGGDTSEHPTIVVYAGDPDHKKGVHVTIHQHTGT
jgi:hypothetical protein